MFSVFCIVCVVLFRVVCVVLCALFVRPYAPLLETLTLSPDCRCLQGFHNDLVLVEVS